MSRIDNLEQRVTDLERNVGSVMGELELVTISTRKASDNYRKGLNNKGKMINSAFYIHTTKVACVIGHTPIYEYDGTAIYDLHISQQLGYVWDSELHLGGGIIRAMTVADIKEFFKNHESFMHLHLVQDINHMSDLYLIP